MSCVKPSTDPTNLPCRGKAREKMLEKELERLLGPNWQVRTHVLVVRAV